MVTLQNITLYIVKGHIADCQLGVEPKLSWQPYTSKVQDALLGGYQATAWPHQHVVQVHAVMLEAALQSLLPLLSPPSCIITVSTSKVCGFGRPTSTQPSSMTQAGTTPHRTAHPLAFVNGLKGCHSNSKQYVDTIKSFFFRNSESNYIFINVNSQLSATDYTSFTGPIITTIASIFLKGEHKAHLCTYYTRRLVLTLSHREDWWCPHRALLTLSRWNVTNEAGSVSAVLSLKPIIVCVQTKQNRPPPGGVQRRHATYVYMCMYVYVCVCMCMYVYVCVCM